MIVISDTAPFVPRGASGMTLSDGALLGALDQQIARQAFKGGQALTHIYEGDALVFTAQSVPKSYFYLILQ